MAESSEISKKWDKRGFIIRNVLAMITIVAIVLGGGAWIGAKASELTAAIAATNLLAMQFGEFDKHVDERFEAVDGRFISVDERLGNLEMINQEILRLLRCQANPESPGCDQQPE